MGRAGAKQTMRNTTDKIWSQTSCEKETNQTLNMPPDWIECHLINKPEIPQSWLKHHVINRQGIQLPTWLEHHTVTIYFMKLCLILHVLLKLKKFDLSKNTVKTIQRTKCDKQTIQPPIFQFQYASRSNRTLFDK